MDSEIICDKCRAGIMEQFQRLMKNGEREIQIRGKKCSRCGYIQINDDDDVWSIVGL